MVRMAHPTDMAIPECHDFATHQSFPSNKLNLLTFHQPTLIQTDECRNILQPSITNNSIGKLEVSILFSISYNHETASLTCRKNLHFLEIDSNKNILGMCYLLKIILLLNNGTMIALVI